MSTPEAPEAAKIEHVREHHGDRVVDPYEWLRDKSDPDVIAHLEAENGYTEAMTAHLDSLRQRVFEEIKGRTLETDLTVPALQNGERLATDRVGLILPTSLCSGQIARQIAYRLNDRAIGGGRLPNARLQELLSRFPKGGPVDKFLAWTHWVWFVEPYLALFVVLVRDNDNFPRAARRMAAVFDAGCATYFAVPTAPPWWSSDRRK